MISTSERQHWANYRHDLEYTSGILFVLFVIAGVLALVVAAVMLVQSQWLGVLLALLQAAVAFVVAFFVRAMGRLVAANFAMLTELARDRDSDKGQVEAED